MSDKTTKIDPKVVKAKRSYLDISVHDAKATLLPLTESLQDALTQIKGSEYEAGRILHSVQFSGILVAAGHPMTGETARVWDEKGMDQDYTAYYKAQGLSPQEADTYVVRFVAGTAVADNTDYLDDGSQIIASHAKAIVPVVRGRNIEAVVKVMDEAFRIADEKGLPMTADDIKEARNNLEILPLRPGGEKTDEMRDAETFGRHAKALADDIEGMDDGTAVRLDNVSIDTLAESLRTLGMRVLALRTAKATADQEAADEAAQEAASVKMDPNAKVAA